MFSHIILVTYAVEGLSDSMYGQGSDVIKLGKQRQEQQQKKPLLCFCIHLG